MPDRWAAATQGRPLAVVIKLRNCTDNESLCLRVKALGDTRRRRQPCWRRQKWSERVLLPPRCQIQAFGDATINRRNQFQFGGKRKNVNPPEFSCLHSSTQKRDWTPKKKKNGRRVHIEGQTEKGQTLKAGLLRSRGICQVSFHCSPFKTSVVNGAAIIRSSLSTKLLRCHLHLEAITIYSYTHAYIRIWGRIWGVGICPEDLLSHWQQLWLPHHLPPPKKKNYNWSKRLILQRVSSFLTLWMSRQIKLSEQQMHDAGAPAAAGFFWGGGFSWNVGIMTINVCGGE